MKRAPVHRTMVFYCCMHEKCEWQYVRNTIDLICFLNISIVSKILKFPCLSLSLCLSAFMRFVFDAKISYLQFVFNICAKENDCHGIWLIHWTQPNNQAQQKEQSSSTKIIPFYFHHAKNRNFSSVQYYSYTDSTRRTNFYCRTMQQQL